MNPREKIALIINESLNRLPLVLEILEEIHPDKGTSQSGDDDLMHGAIRAIRSMIGRLERIQPAPCGNHPTDSEAEQIAGEWLLGKLPKRLIPAPLLEQISAAISRLLPQPAQHRHNNELS